METGNLLVQELLALSTSYRTGSVPLPSLASRAEILVEQMQPHLSPDEFASAMNCVYLIEDINAVVLDENRKLAKEEKDEVERQLNLLEKLITSSSNAAP